MAWCLCVKAKDWSQSQNLSWRTAVFKSCYYKDLQYFLVTFASSSVFVCANLLQMRVCI